MIKHFFRVFNTLVGDLSQILSMINIFGVSMYIHRALNEEQQILVCFNEMMVKCSYNVCSLRGDVWA